MVRKRRRHTAAYKFRVAMKALEGSKTIYGEPPILGPRNGKNKVHPDGCVLPPTLWRTRCRGVLWRRPIQMSVHDQSRQNATRTGAVDAPNRSLRGNF